MYGYRSLPNGFYVKVIEPDNHTADYITKYWQSATFDYPLEHSTRFLRDTIARFEVLGVYTVDDHKYPVAWAGVKQGNKNLVNYSVR